MENKLQELLSAGKVVALDKKFEGTYEELKSLVEDGTIVPVIQNDMLVGFQYVGAKSFAEDQLLEMQFKTAYFDTPVVEWLTEILGLEDEKESISEVDKESVESVVLKNPCGLYLDKEDIVTAVKYLLGHFFKRGTDVEIEKTARDYLVTNIELGRKLTSAEKDRLARKLFTRSGVEVRTLSLA